MSLPDSDLAKGIKIKCETRTGYCTGTVANHPPLRSRELIPPSFGAGRGAFGDWLSQAPIEMAG